MRNHAVWSLRRSPHVKVVLCGVRCHAALLVMGPTLTVRAARRSGLMIGRPASIRVLWQAMPSCSAPRVACQ